MSLLKSLGSLRDATRGLKGGTIFELVNLVTA